MCSVPPGRLLFSKQSVAGPAFPRTLCDVLAKAASQLSGKQPNSGSSNNRTANRWKEKKALSVGCERHGVIPSRPLHPPRVPAAVTCPSAAGHLVGSRAEPQHRSGRTRCLGTEVHRAPVQPLPGLKTGADFQKTLPGCPRAREELHLHLV